MHMHREREDVVVAELDPVEQSTGGQGWLSSSAPSHLEDRQVCMKVRGVLAPPPLPHPENRQVSVKFRGVSVPGYLTIRTTA